MAAAHPFPFAQGSSCVPDETAMLWLILFLEEAAFPGGSVAQFSGAVYTISPLPCESVNRSELLVWFASPCVAGSACHTSLLDGP